MQNDKYRMTLEGLQNLKKELAERKKKRKVILQSLESTRADGDLRENAGFHLSKQMLEENDSRTAELEYMIRNVEIVEKMEDVIGVGSTVELKYSDGKVIKVKISTELETDPLNGVFSEQSPLGTAISGKKVGDKIKYETPAGIIECEIVKIGHLE